MRTLLVLAAGIGSRYGGFKQIDPLGEAGETAIDYALYDAWQAGFTRVVFVTRPELEDSLRKHFAGRLDSRLAMDFVFQDLRDLPNGAAAPNGRQKPWGTGHAVWSARGAISGPFGVVNADDFYGRDAYRRLAEFLAAAGQGGEIAGPPEYAVVGYPLGRTLSPHGTVSRAVCQVGPGNRLETIVERTKIGYIPPREVLGAPSMDSGSSRRGAETQRKPGSVGWQDEGGGWHPLRGDEPVSMNMWGFTPAVFPQLEREFASFLAERGADPKAEFYIPWAVDRWIRAGTCRVTVLPTDAEWFGMTYPEDRPEVQARIRALTARSEYPSPLWR